MSRYVIVGAGAVGATIGAHLYIAGHDVLLVARGDHLVAIRESGLRFIRPHHEEVLPIDVASSYRDGDPHPGDVILLTTKSGSSRGALEDIAGHISRQPLICAQNGVENEREALRRVDNVYAMCVNLPASYTEPGVIISYGAPYPGILDLGRYPQGTDDVAVRIADVLEGSGFRSRADPYIMRRKYRKLARNVCNAVVALSGPDARDSELAEMAESEALRVLLSAGIDVATPAEDEARRRGVCEPHEIDRYARQGSSSWQSLARSTGSIEADFLNGEIVLLGRLYDIPTPVNAFLQREANSFAIHRHPPGSLPIGELRKRFDMETETN